MKDQIISLYSKIYDMACDQYSDVDMCDLACVEKYLIKDLGFSEEQSEDILHLALSYGRRAQGLY